MLEHTPSIEQPQQPEVLKKPEQSRFFEYAESRHGEGIEESLKAAKVTLEAIKSAEGIFFEDVAMMYPLIDQRLLVRREDVRVAMGSMLKGEDILINPQRVYPNVAWWDIAKGSEGLKNAFLEGHAQLNGVVAVLGFEATDRMIVVDQKDIPDEPSVFVGASGSQLDRHLVASAHGTVTHDDIRFAVFRFPYKFFPESEMTDDEVEGGEKNLRGKLQYMFRGIYFTSKETKPTLH